MTTRKLKLNERYHCVFCGRQDNQRQSIRHIEHDRSVFVFNCGYCAIKFSVLILKEGFIHPKDSITTQRFPDSYWDKQ